MRHQPLTDIPLRILDTSRAQTVATSHELDGGTGYTEADRHLWAERNEIKLVAKSRQEFRIAFVPSIVAHRFAQQAA